MSKFTRFYLQTAEIGSLESEAQTSSNFGRLFNITIPADVNYLYIGQDGTTPTGIMSIYATNSDGGKPLSIIDAFKGSVGEEGRVDRSSVFGSNNEYIDAVWEINKRLKLFIVNKLPATAYNLKIIMNVTDSDSLLS
jgi:hypothetical protein